MLPIHTELLREVYSGQSLSKLNEVNATIQGRKFHTDTHILYDIRTILGNQEPRNYLEIGAYVGSSASLMLSHPYSTNVSSIDPMFLPHSH